MQIWVVPVTFPARRIVSNYPPPAMEAHLDYIVFFGQFQLIIGTAGRVSHFAILAGTNRQHHSILLLKSIQVVLGHISSTRRQSRSAMKSWKMLSFQCGSMIAFSTLKPKWKHDWLVVTSPTQLKNNMQAWNWTIFPKQIGVKNSKMFELKSPPPSHDCFYNPYLTGWFFIPYYTPNNNGLLYSLCSYQLHQFASPFQRPSAVPTVVDQKVHPESSSLSHG